MFLFVELALEEAICHTIKILKNPSGEVHVWEWRPPANSQYQFTSYAISTSWKWIIQLQPSVEMKAAFQFKKFTFYILSHHSEWTLINGRQVGQHNKCMVKIARNASRLEGSLLSHYAQHSTHSEDHKS